MYNVAIVTLSDKGYEGKREDITGSKLKEFVESYDSYKVVEYILIKDDKEMLKEKLVDLCDNKSVDLVITNGGTGFSKRDITPEGTKDVIERDIPGLSEYMRMESSKITKKAILSRGICGIRKSSIIINLPGSPKGAIENLGFIIDVIGHGIEILRGEATECATKTENSI
ncbi:MAG: MogA/MoaB family molybdenum cofactor biosynthesis protein [Peptostreptococcaceae bacterium]